jgi:hypothetical protein
MHNASNFEKKEVLSLTVKAGIGKLENFPRPGKSGPLFSLSFSLNQIK